MSRIEELQQTSQALSSFDECEEALSVLGFMELPTEQQVNARTNMTRFIAKPSWRTYLSVKLP
eukprot:1550916-Amphidinium_carterae.1